jgi:hypothetical protein
MPDYLFLMHNDTLDKATEGNSDNWVRYIGGLQQSGSFQSGSAIGAGTCVRKSGATPAITSHFTGFIRVHAESLDHARKLLTGNPVFEAGGTVEIRELPRTD